MTEIIFGLCALMSIVTATLLVRGYRQERSHILLWSSLSFGILAVTNMILFVDLVVLPEVEFHGSLLRNLSGATAATLLVFGLIWELA